MFSILYIFFIDALKFLSFTCFLYCFWQFPFLSLYSYLMWELRSILLYHLVIGRRFWFVILFVLLIIPWMLLAHWVFVDWYFCYSSYSVYSLKIQFKTHSLVLKFSPFSNHLKSLLAFWINSLYLRRSRIGVQLNSFILQWGTFRIILLFWYYFPRFCCRFPSKYSVVRI